MRCEHCGKENREDAKFCLNCGRRVQSLAQERLAEKLEAEMSVPMTEQVVPMPEPETVLEPAPRKKRDLRKIRRLIILVAALLIVAVAAVCVYRWFTRDKYFAENTYLVLQDENGKAVVVYNDTMIMDGMDVANIMEKSLDGKTALIRVHIGDEPRTYVAVEGNWTELKQNNAAAYATLAMSGNAAVYYTYPEGDGGYDLYYYDCQEQSTKHIERFRAPVYVISPNGEYVCYKTEDGVYRWKDGEAEQLCDEGGALCVSDKGIAYVAEDGTLYSYDKNGERTKVLNLKGEGINNWGTNRSGSQLMFYVGNECYFSEDGKKAQEIDGDTDQISGYCYVIGNGDIADLREQVYIDRESDKILFLTKDLRADVILDDVADFERAHDNSGLYAVTREGRLYSIDPDAGEKERLAKDAEYVYAAGKGIAYYVNEDDELYQVKNGKQTLVSEDYYDAVGTDDGGVLYLEEDGTLYKAGKNGKKTEIAQDADDVWRSGAWFYYTAEEDGKCPVYVSKDGEDFTRIEGVYCE